MFSTQTNIRITLFWILLRQKDPVLNYMPDSGPRKYGFGIEFVLTRA